MLAALLGIWTPLSFATAKPLNKVDPTTFIISHQQQQSGTQAFPLLPAYHRHSSPSINPSAIGKRDGIHVQELSSNFILHYQIFQTFAPDWTTASRLATFWYNLGIQLPDVPDHLFLDNVLRFRSGPLSLELFDASGGAGGIPREFILALASAMVGYTERGFCGMFNARVSSRGDAVGGASAGVKLWITFRIVGGLGEAIRV